MVKKLNTSTPPYTTLTVPEYKPVSRPVILSGEAEGLIKMISSVLDY